MEAFLSELVESVPNMLILWRLIAIASPVVPVKSYRAFRPEIFVVPLGMVIPENAGVLAKPCNTRNGWLMYGCPIGEIIPIYFLLMPPKTCCPQVAPKIFSVPAIIF